MKTEDAYRPAVTSRPESGGPDAYREAIARLPTGVAVITASGAEGPVGCTVNAVMSLSLDPPSLLVSFGTGSRTLARVTEAGRFAVNVLSWEDRRLARQFATGTAAQRFAGVPWAPVLGVPVLSGAVVGLVCDVSETIPALDHTLVVGRVRTTTGVDAEPTVLFGHGQYALRG
ncbi:flavin reductase family protein [Kitasatospora sp. NPDC036755]|uniref:flavin reductase family protein n=1 Tax=Kitasatospora sp. NPDC036755 TaxID=3154600 RepID=UPI0033F1A5BC